MKKVLLFMGVVALFLNSCTDLDKQSAKVIDSAVEGLEYQCTGNVEYTTKDGALGCYYTPIGFKVGGVKIGLIDKIPADGIILPQDMLQVERTDIDNEDVKKLAILLQTIDSDNNPDNGITILKSDADKLDMFIDLKKTPLIEFKELISALLEKEIVDEDSAIEHLYSSMKEFNIKEAETIKLKELE